MKKLYFSLCVLFATSLSLLAQINYTAKDIVQPYEGVFRPGSNLGYFPPWTDEDLANIAAGNEAENSPGVGIKAIRPGMFNSFTEEWGYELRVPTYEHFEQLGLKDNTLIVGFPADEFKDTTHHCPDYQSAMFANLYKPIWTTDSTGNLQVNPENYYAAYLAKLVNIYGDHIKFWEIWNEPGFDFSGAKGWLPPGFEGNWWDTDPDPCHNILRAPIQQYIRTLRISYEVIKTLSPDDYICVSGTGYPSFLDAILRNTDNPNGGEITEDFPHRGGAYFDVMGFHSYPHFDGATRQWNNQIRDFEYFRHSDAAAAGIARTKGIYSRLLEQYGYNSNQYPEKEWIITEFNIPRRSYSEFLGGEEIQVNTLMKSFVVAQRENIRQLHIYSLAEQKTFREATNEFDLMGLYKKVGGLTPYRQTINDAGIAYKTCSDELFGKEYDRARTAALQLPNHIDGAAFRDDQGFYTYMLWAKTDTDLSEEVNALYSFPASFNIYQLARHEWDYSDQQNSTLINTDLIELSARPILLQESLLSYAKPECAPANVDLIGMLVEEAASWSWEIDYLDSIGYYEGRRLTAHFPKSGNFKIKLVIKDADDNLLVQQEDFIRIKGFPYVDYRVEVSGPIVSIVDPVYRDIDDFLWDFGDGNSSSEAAPFHTYDEGDIYDVTFTTTNQCGNLEIQESIAAYPPSKSVLGYNANDQVLPNNSFFRPGSNLGYFPPWSDEELATVAAGDPSLGVEGTGVRALRPALYGSFVKEWGYDFREETFDHYENLGLRENTLIVGFPALEETDLNLYCPDVHSELFDRLYHEIWDNGENGTPINEENYYATYLYQLVRKYGDHVRYWEIWNEPGFDYTGSKGWLPEDQPGNWWANDPDPCDYKLRAPIQHYIRLMRVSYEIIKSLEPTDYVVLSGTGYLSFLDAFLRNTDNPVDGSVRVDYPHKGGAYFDVMGFHSYPHFDGTTKYWDSETNQFAYERHSDAAANGVLRVKNNMQNILDKHGYNGEQYPEKLWTITEINIPRRNFNDFIGGDEAQCNFMMKAYVNCAVNDFIQMHVYSLGEQLFEETASYEFDLMGLYKRLRGTAPMSHEQTNAGIGYQTTSELLYGTTYDSERTAALEAPTGVKAYAFRDVEGEYVYVLWAETKIDNEETANATYRFPRSLWQNNFTLHEWDFAVEKNAQTIDNNRLQLNASPIFITATEITNMPVAGFQTEQRVGCVPYEVSFTNVSKDAQTWTWTFMGGIPETSTERNPTVMYADTGSYAVQLRISNALGEHSYTFKEFIQVRDIPVADFEYEVDGMDVNFTVLTENEGDVQYNWDFGDGRTYATDAPLHQYLQNGSYEVSMFPFDGCVGETVSQMVTIAAPPMIENKLSTIVNCEQTVANFTNLSTNTDGNVQWYFPGGSPSASTANSVTVAYQKSGVYEAMMIVQNEVAADTIRQTIEVEVSPRSYFEPTICPGDTVFINGNFYHQYKLYGIERYARGDNQCDSLVIVNVQFQPEAKLHINQRLCVGQSLTFNGHIYDENNPSGIERIQRAGQCDSLIIVNLSYESIRFDNYQETLCATGDEVEFFGKIHDRPGFYRDTALTEEGCILISSLSLDLNRPIRVETNEIIADDGNGSGAIRLDIAGGTAPYEVIWDNEMEGIFIENLSAGTYEATVTDAVGCEMSISVIVPSGSSNHIQTYPNPVGIDQWIQLTIESDRMQRAVVDCFDVSGKRIQQQSFEVTAGANQVLLRAPNHSGTYTLQVHLETSNESYRLLQVVAPMDAVQVRQEE
ncbi:MAG: PKD domain-containing protein [Bacteroidota bacterium]